MNEGDSADPAAGLFRPRQAQTPAAQAWRADIDGLRALAVSAVVLGHYWPRCLPGGYVGVDVFFVISGYLITQILLRQLAQGRFGWAEFYVRRARRLLPALFVVLSFSCLAGFVLLLPSDLVAMHQALLATLLFSANLLFWRQSSNYFDATESLDNPLLHLWSLGVEEQFYLFFPCFLLAVHAWARHRATPPMPLLRRLLWLLAVLNLWLAAWANARNSTAAFYLSPLRAWEFLAGAIAALPSLQQGAPWAGPAWIRASRSMALAALVACMALYSEHTPFPGWAALPPVLATAVLLRTGNSNSPTAWSLSWPPWVALGQVSYSLYLWHWPVLVFARHHLAGQLTESAKLAVLLLALGASVLSWRFVEQPWRRPAGGRFVKAGWVWPSAVAALVGVSVLGLVLQGQGSRVSAAVLALDRSRSEAVPWQACANLPMDKACRLGESQAQPDVLLWGDSHMVAWAPALDRWASQARHRAVLAAFLGCAPLIQVLNTRNRACQPANESLWAYLKEHPEIRTVVMAAYWGHYFQPDSTAQAWPGASRHLEGVEAVRHGLAFTIGRLVEEGREVILIGPVPTYDYNVPQTLALRTWRNVASPSMPAQAQRQRQDGFWRAAEAWRLNPQVRLLNPIDWFCQPECVMQALGESLYRDAHHINAAGARWAEADLARSLSQLRHPVQP